MTRVSYVLATWNRAKYISKALDNIRSFFTEEDELVIADGGSTDGTVDLINRAADLSPLLVSAPDTSEAHALNRAILKSSGRIIKILMDDDFFYPEGMLKAIEILEEHPEIEALICPGEKQDWTSPEHVTLWRFNPKFNFKLSDWSTRNPLHCLAGLFLTRECVAKVGLFDPSFRPMDLDYHSRLLINRAELYCLDVRLYRHIRYPHSGGQLARERRRDQARLCLRHHDWPGLLSLAHTHPDAVSDALGLSALKDGELLLSILLTVERLRRSPTLLKLVETGLRTTRTLIRNLRVRRADDTPTATKSGTLPERDWTEELVSISPYCEISPTVPRPRDLKR